MQRAGIILVALLALGGCSWFKSTTSDTCEVVLLRLDPLPRTSNAFVIVLTAVNGNEVEGVYELIDTVLGSLGARQNHDTITFDLPPVGTVVTHSVYARRDSCLTAPVPATVPSR